MDSRPDQGPEELSGQRLTGQLTRANVRDHVRAPGFLRVPKCPAELRCAGREQPDGLVRFPPRSSHADAEPGRELRERLAQVCEGQQGLLALVWQPGLPGTDRSD
jgi:hypothetical protein